MSRAHSARASPALHRLAEDDPALGALALWCAHRDAEGALPAWSDGETVFYGPGFAALAPHEQAGLAAHHVLHTALRHAARGAGMRAALGAGFDAALFNIAADVLVNETLLAGGHALPRPALRLAGVLGALPGGAAPQARALADWDVEALYRALGGADDGSDRASGRAGAVQAHAAAQAFSADLRMAAHADDGDTPEAADWQMRLAQALDMGRAAGRGIGALGWRIGDLPRPRTRWQPLLRGLALRALTMPPRLSWARPARRWLAQDSEARARALPAPAFAPGTRRPPGRARLALCLDSSSSVSVPMLRQFAAQVGLILHQSGAEGHVLIFDEAVRATRELAGPGWQADLAALPFSREGGTDFAPVLRAAQALAPSAIIVLTDLDAPLPDARPAAPVIWAVPAPPARPPAWGRVVLLEG